MNKTYTFTLTEEQLKDLIINYTNEYHDLRYSYSQYSSGYCTCAKNWMKALGISVESISLKDKEQSKCYTIE